MSTGQQDWLINPCVQPATIDSGQNRLILSNGLISRCFVTTPNFTTINYSNLVTESSLLRGIKPEATLVVDGQQYAVGGLLGQPDYAYLDPEWIEDLTNDPSTFQFQQYRVNPINTYYPWMQRRHATSTRYPPSGIRLSVDFLAPAKVSAHTSTSVIEPANLQVTIHYDLYQGIPVLAKWIEVNNLGRCEVQLEALSSEILAINEQEKHRLHIESDYAFSQMKTTQWGPDVDYKTQTDYHYQMLLLMTSTYPLGPGVILEPGQTFASFRTFELLHDSDDRERKGLARRKMYRTIAPQVTENPIFMHVRQSNPEAVRLAIDQCASVGFEMVIMTFGSGFNIESEDPDYIAQMKRLADYAHSKGVEIGGYTLMCASRGISPEFNCIDPETGAPGSRFGQSVCLASKWTDGYFRRVLNFMDATGMDIIETDGPYHGDVCASKNHIYHHGLEDSQLRQWQACVDFYHQCQQRGIYINSPDHYYLNGSNKCGMGYRETNFSLPRERQILIARQNIYDATYEKTPSMGWMFVPLVEYHGGGEAATFEPLHQHLADYEWHLAQNFGSGVIACYRGPRLYDTEETKAVVKKWVDFYKRYRTLLESDLIHIRRPDGGSIDCMLHVNPVELSPDLTGDTSASQPDSVDTAVGLAMLYNPVRQLQRIRLNLPLYYTGLSKTTWIRRGRGLDMKEGEPACYTIDRDYNVQIEIEMAARSIDYLVVEAD